MTLARTAVRGSAASIGGQGFRIVLQLVGLAVLARLLEPADFGVVAMVTAAIGLADILRDFGLSSAAVQAPSVSRGERVNLFWANTGLGLLCTVAVAASTPLLVALYDEPTLAHIVPALSLVLLISGINTQYRADLGRALRFVALASSDVLAQLVGTLVAIAVALLGGGYWAIVAQQLTVAVVALVVNVVSTRWRPGLPQRCTSIRRFFRFGLSVFGTQVLGYAAKNADTVALGAFWGSSVLGGYNRAQQIAVVPLNQINGPLTRVALPMLSKAHLDPARFSRAVLRAQLAGAYGTATVLAFVAGLAVPIVAVLLGPGWSEAAPILALLAIAGVFRSLSQLAYWMFLSSGRPGAQFALDLWAQPVMVAVIVLGASQGAVGAAWAAVAVWPVYWIVGLLVASRSAGLAAGPLVWRAVRALLGVALPAALASWYVSQAIDGPLIALAAGLAAGAALVAVVALAVRPVRRDVAEVVTLVRHAAQRGEKTSPQP
ncbi:lipopolysaccharide biosynthesis protein [Cellulomonas humilata]|uniref:Lipopolysaccharide biosynthesis protein n=1 Tax=Cellulomonas humilata TaxID=144055 RepID=A0A7Y6DXB3_9CELL|nr:lipopolysaccharide biosynthesis protein [Cellulomonas humilata]NUU16867.1 lipopolysaccharide biosynthesis protein [Cellulomonas humilata]